MQVLAAWQHALLRFVETLRGIAACQLLYTSLPNPVLTSTLVGLACCSVQVSHHPPVSAAHAENSSWTYDIVSAPTTKFLGNSLEVYPKGECRFHQCCMRF